MIFNYTTSEKGGVASLSNSLSIGGYKSSSSVENDVMDNLFDEISTYGMSKAKTEYRALMFTNTMPVPLKNVKMYLKGGGGVCRMGLSVAGTVKDGSGYDYMERVADIYSKPIIGQFYYPTEQNKLAIGDIEPDVPLGIWFQRIIDSDLVNKEYNDVFEEDPNNLRRYKPIIKSKSEGWELIMEWD